MSKQNRQCQKCGSLLERLAAAEIASQLDKLLERIADRPQDPTLGYEQRRNAEERATLGRLIDARIGIGVLRDRLQGYCGLCAPTLSASFTEAREAYRLSIDLAGARPPDGHWLAIAPYGARHIVLATADSREQAHAAGCRQAAHIGLHAVIELLEASAELATLVREGTTDCARLGLWRDSSGWHLPRQGGSASAELERAVDQSTSRPAY